MFAALSASSSLAASAEFITVTGRNSTVGHSAESLAASSFLRDSKSKPMLGQIGPVLGVWEKTSRTRGFTPADESTALATSGDKPTAPAHDAQAAMNRRRDSPQHPQPEPNS